MPLPNAKRICSRSAPSFVGAISQRSLWNGSSWRTLTVGKWPVATRKTADVWLSWNSKRMVSHSLAGLKQLLPATHVSTITENGELHNWLVGHSCFQSSLHSNQFFVNSSLSLAHSARSDISHHNTLISFSSGIFHTYALCSGSKTKSFLSYPPWILCHF